MEWEIHIGGDTPVRRACLELFPVESGTIPLDGGRDIAQRAQACPAASTLFLTTWCKIGQLLIRRIVSSREASSMPGVEKHSEEEPSGRRFLDWVVRHLG